MNNTEKIFNFIYELEYAVLTKPTLSIDRVLHKMLSEQDEHMQDLYKEVLDMTFKDNPEFVQPFLKRLMK